MANEDRQHAQDEFAAERCDVIVATVAFGMGVDRSNVRFVLHTGMPKSLEHYQQEAGRAGRDGLEAECVLLYSGADPILWRKMISNPRDAETPPDPQFVAASLKHLDDMDRYARGAVCRHRALVEYFDQPYEKAACGACDLCLGDTEEVADALTVAKKILSCVARVREGFGVVHVIAVLRGDNTDNVRKRGHEQLTTYGLLKEHSAADVRDWVYQLIGQGFLVQTDTEYPLLKLNDASWEVMRGQRSVRLIRLKRRKKGEGPRASQAAEVSWEGVDRTLFDELRRLRKELADQRGVSPFIVFTDATLREMARVRPTTPERLRQISGVGEARLREYGERFLAAIGGHSQAHGLSTDRTEAPAPVEPKAPRQMTPRLETAFALFRAGALIEDVMRQLNLARGTVTDYLAEFIRREKPRSIDEWVVDGVRNRVVEAARQVGMARLKPIYLFLGETVSYDVIRLVLAYLEGRGIEETEST
jgi:ATP-dependent DNA helicase RecQ